MKVWRNERSFQSRSCHKVENAVCVALLKVFMKRRSVEMIGVLTSGSGAGWFPWMWILVLGMTPLVFAEQSHPDKDGFVVLSPDELIPRGGARAVNIVGNPRESGIYVMRITFEPGTGTRPHFHSHARHITVIRGSWWVAFGPDAVTYNPDKMVQISPGTFLFQPANGVHYDQARDEEVTVQITGMGPVETSRLVVD